MVHTKPEARYHSVSQLPLLPKGKYGSYPARGMFPLRQPDPPFSKRKIWFIPLFGKEG
jgi:hypothetical protein